MSFIYLEVQIRIGRCRDCRTPCEDYNTGKIDHANPCARCPLKRPRWHPWIDCEAQARPAAVGPVVTAPPPLSVLWGELHRRALGWVGGEDSAWLARFTDKVPCGECRQHWLAILAGRPPTWSAYFAWTVDVHNAINRRLGKSEITLGAAAGIWSGSLKPPLRNSSGQTQAARG